MHTLLNLKLFKSSPSKNIGLLTTTVAMVTLCTSVFAKPYPDEVGICYQFSGDELVKKELCIISTGYGAGASYTNMQIRQKDYLIETNRIIEKDFYGTEPVNSYLREASFYQRTNNVEEDEKLLYCYESASINMCHN